jgi:hypothetical protein
MSELGTTPRLLTSTPLLLPLRRIPVTFTFRAKTTINKDRWSSGSGALSRMPTRAGWYWPGLTAS